MNHFPGGITPNVESVVWSDLWAAFPWPVQINEALWHNHVSMVGLHGGGQWPAFRFYGCHVTQVVAANKTTILFLGSELEQGTEKSHLYSMKVTDEESFMCLTCSIDNCSRVSVSVNQNMTQAVIT